MTVIAFRPRPRAPSAPPELPVPLTGTFRSPRGRLGRLEGSLRVRRLVLVPRGAFVTGVVTGTLRDDDGTVIGVDSRRATLGVELVREGNRYLPVAHAFRLDLMGITVDVEAAVVASGLALPWRAPQEVSRGPGPAAPGEVEPA